MIRKAVFPVCLALICLSILLAPSVGRAQVVTMGLFPDALPPFVNEAPDSSGFYKDLFTMVGKKTGFGVRIVRLPLREMLIALQQGAVDFHPYLQYLYNRDDFVQFFRIFRTGTQSTYLAWSRASKFYRAYFNSGYRILELPTPVNTRYTIRPDCQAAKFLSGLQEVRKTGYMDALRIKYGLR